LNFGIDELLFRDAPLSPLTSYPAGWAEHALNHVLIGAALLLARSSAVRAGRRASAVAG